MLKQRALPQQPISSARALLLHRTLEMPKKTYDKFLGPPLCFNQDALLLGVFTREALNSADHWFLGRLIHRFLEAFMYEGLIAYVNPQFGENNSDTLIYC